MSGYTFNPHDSELISYLNNKIIGKDLGTESEINEVNICHHEPADIPGLARMDSTHTWHVISPVEKLKGRCERTKRSSKTGHWKITGKDFDVKDFDGNIIGFKKILVFRDNKQNSSSLASTSTQQNKFTWVIHEFHSTIQHPNKDAFVLCQLMKKTKTPRRNSIATDSILTSDIVVSHSEVYIVGVHMDKVVKIGGIIKLNNANDTVNNTYNEDIVEEDYFEGLEDLVPGFQTTEWCI